MALSRHLPGRDKQNQDETPSQVSWSKTSFEPRNSEIVMTVTNVPQPGNHWHVKVNCTYMKIPKYEPDVIGMQPYENTWHCTRQV